VVQTDARIESARSQLAQYQANLDSSKATLMSFLGWNSLNSISNEFPVKLDSSCDVVKPDDKLVPAVLAAWAQANVRRQPRLRQRADDAHHLSGAVGSALSQRQIPQP
jgi:adhesin transport system outer membrane protein